MKEYILSVSCHAYQDYCVTCTGFPVQINQGNVTELFRVEEAAAEEPTQANTHGYVKYRVEVESPRTSTRTEKNVFSLKGPC